MPVSDWDFVAKFAGIVLFVMASICLLGVFAVGVGVGAYFF